MLIDLFLILSVRRTSPYCVNQVRVSPHIRLSVFGVSQKAVVFENINLTGVHDAREGFSLSRAIASRGGCSVNCVYRRSTL